jgi:hypothetical protein
VTGDSYWNEQYIIPDANLRTSNFLADVLLKISSRVKKTSHDAQILRMRPRISIGSLVKNTYTGRMKKPPSVWTYNDLISDLWLLDLYLTSVQRASTMTVVSHELHATVNQAEHERRASDVFDRSTDAS